MIRAFEAMGGHMHFLLNDAVFALKAEELSPRVIGFRFASVDFDFVTTLGRELFAQAPLAHLTHPGRARRLCALIRFAAPAVNAALFLAPGDRCSPAEVDVQFASLDAGQLALLQRRHAEGALTPLVADREVWKRLAA
jgi:hypothetical protein